ncbi:MULTISPECIES: ABC transporter permease subunit [unclassified Lysinibacillus]|uniref:ABC transporter permease n=1 Tax=unclassified Lysinibacillus TaxID=2636778 RepID=UPI002012AD84|nr:MULTISPECIES: ABC transporter permease subunit [unclassified Lysinibacillus]MCL1695622.1 ABC transporter permease [Lysinibacillus sp. BPa_S21]MCL1700133.1 ABC transporter permease [Lysinibacillus sp. Bpr_S20]
MTLIKLELYKIIKKKFIMIFLGFLTLIVIGAAVYNVFQIQESNQVNDWKSELESRNIRLAEANENLAETSLAYVSNKEKIILNEYRIENNIKPDQEQNVWTFIKSIQPLLSFLGILTVMIASSIVSEEFDKGTVKIWLTRPISKNAFLFSKYMAVVMSNFLAVFFLLLIAFLVGIVFFGFDGPKELLIINNNNVDQVEYWYYMLRYYLFTAIDLSIFCTLAYTLSALIRNTYISLGLTLFAYFTGNIATRIIGMKFSWAKFILFANTDFNVYVDGTEVIAGMTPLFSAIIVLLYIFLFLSITFLVFNRRDLSF